MNRYKVILSRCVSESFEVEAENQEEAFEKANDEFDTTQYDGCELYDDNQTNEIEEIKN